MQQSKVNVRANKILRDNESSILAAEEIDDAHGMGKDTNSLATEFPQVFYFLGNDKHLS